EGLCVRADQEHATLIYREATQVPLFFKLPGSARAGERISAPVGLVDVAPTICRVLGVPCPATGGRDLLTMGSGSPPVYSETFYPRIYLVWSEWRSLVSGSSHYISAPLPELFDLDRDPHERRSVLEDQRSIAF